jgi:hypothetical protein
VIHDVNRDGHAICAICRAMDHQHIPRQCKLKGSKLFSFFVQQKYLTELCLRKRFEVLLYTLFVLKIFWFEERLFFVEQSLSPQCVYYCTTNVSLF